MSPLQVAVKEGNMPMIVKLLQHGASLGHLDNDSNTVFHYAATINKEVISVSFFFFLAIYLVNYLLLCDQWFLK